MRHSEEESQLECAANLDDGFGDRTPACREHTLPHANSDSRIFAAISGQTKNGPVLRVHIIQYLDINGLKIQVPTTTTKERTSWVVICRGKKPLHGEVTSQ